MSSTDAAPTRRSLLSTLTIALGAVGVGGIGWILVRSSDDGPGLKPAPEDVRFSLSSLPKGHQMVVKWAGRPVLIAHRSDADVDALASDKPAQPHPRIADDPALPDYKPNRGRSLKTDWFVATAVCTYHNCVVQTDDSRQGFACPCCGSRYDLAGRVYSGPAPRNLAIPPYHFDGPDTLVIGQGPLGGSGTEV